MLSTINSTCSTGDLLGLRPKQSSPYSVYGCGCFVLQTVASHPVLQLVRRLLIVGVSSWLLLSPLVAQAANACLDEGKFPGVQSECSAGSPGFPGITVNPDDSNNPISPFVKFGCSSGQSCFVATGDALCAGLAQNASKTGVYSCATGSACPTGRTPLEAAFQPGGGACGGGKVCCAPAPGASNVPGDSAGGSGGSGGGSIALPDPLGGVSLPVLIGNAVRAFAGVAGAIALLMFVYGGIMWIISSGDKGKVAKAQSILKNAVIGLVLIFGAYFFVAAIIGGILTNPTVTP